jgi:hypothetical protein
MALIWLEGFEGISSTTGTSSKNDCDVFMERTPLGNLGHGPEQNSEPMIFDGNGSGQSITLGDDSLADECYLEFAPPAGTTTIICGIAVRSGLKDNTDNNACTGHLIRIMDPASDVEDHMEIYLREGSHMEVHYGGSYKSTIPFACRTNRWEYIEFKFVLGGGTSGSLEIRVNGITILNDTGVDTQTSSGTDIGTIVVIGGQGSTTDVNENRLLDDWYVCDTTGTDNNDFLGPLKVETLLPSAAGDSSDFTPLASTNVSQVDEVVVDDASSYNGSSTVGHLDLFNMDDLTDIDGTIFGVQLDLNSAATDATVMDLIPTVKHSTTEGAGSAIKVVDNTIYATYYGIFEENPNGSTAWTATTINAFQCGYEVG